MKNSVKAIILVVVICICVCTAVLITKHSKTNEPSETDVAEGSYQKTDVSSTENMGENSTGNKRIYSGFELSNLFQYSGEYVEDGSDEYVENTAAVTIKNVSGTDCRYAEVRIVTDDGDYEFSFTTLRNNESVTVLEKNRKNFVNSKIDNISFENVSAFIEEPQLYEDIFELTINDGVINIKNISDTDIDGTVYVYYKNIRDGELFGGITYRVPFDSLKAGELKQASSKHLSTQNSVMEFITYEH